MKYTPNPAVVAEKMLHSMGLNNMEDLFSDIPAKLQVQEGLNLPPAMGEVEIRREFQALAAKNMNTEQYPCFLGAGAYDHYIPAALEQLLLRSEFYTAYTPYQPEISQGILQSIFEYQTMICQLTAMDIANASMYDGGSALAEACNLVAISSKRKRILVPDSIHPEYLEVLKTYAISGAMEIVVVAAKEGSADIELISKMVDKETAAVVMQQPNFFGKLEEITDIEQIVHQNKASLIMVVDPISLSILKSPGEWGADIVVGDGQSLGNSMSFGGPHLGFFATSKKFLRKLPGRVVGQTVDTYGKRAFVLTLQAREQHIRREKANSNICSNQALNALAASMYLSFIGPKGLKAVAMRSHQMAVYAQTEIEKAGLKLKYAPPYFREFAVLIDDPKAMNQRLLENGIIGGYELEDALLLAFTEKRTKAEIDKLVSILGGKNNA